MSMNMNRFLFPLPFVEDVDTRMNGHIIFSTFHKKYLSFAASRARVSTSSTENLLSWRPAGSRLPLGRLSTAREQWRFWTGGLNCVGRATVARYLSRTSRGGLSTSSTKLRRLGQRLGGSFLKGRGDD